MYLSGNDKDFTFKHEKIHVISSDDVLISDEIYNRFFDMVKTLKEYLKRWCKWHNYYKLL